MFSFGFHSMFWSYGINSKGVFFSFLSLLSFLGGGGMGLYILCKEHGAQDYKLFGMHWGCFATYRWIYKIDAMFNWISNLEISTIEGRKESYMADDNREFVCAYYNNN